ncbi:hypothetical protein KKE68_05400, partial [Patescibacteria group bacterium]|nr:hypothetical protein [Patescibacteria group bacterium]
MKRVERIISFLLVIFLLNLPVFISIVNAFDAPRIYVKELNVNQASINAGDGISGDFLMWNTASEIMSDLDYKVSLEQDHNAYGEEINHVSGQIYPDKTLRQDFSYKIPQNIQTGDYIFKIQLFSQSGMALNWGEKNIKIKGSAGGYLVIGSASVIKNGESNQPLKGVGFKIGEVPKIKFTASNPSSQEITFKPSVEVYWFQTNLNKTDEFVGESQILAVNESKEIEIAMPKYQKPGSYLASVVLSSNNIDVSNTEKFRWVLKGEGARILSVKINNDLLKVGEDARITVEFVGSADALDKGEATLVVNLFDNSGKNLFSQERKVQLGDTVVAEVFSFIPTSYIANPRIEAKIIRNGKELNSYTAQIKTPGVEGGTEKIEDLSPIKQNYFLTGVIAIGLLIIIFIMARVLFKKMKLYLLLILMSVGFLFVGTGKIQAATVLWQEPVRDSIFNVGDPVTFKGNLTLSGCDNGIDYITKVFACDINLFNCIYMDKKYNYNLDPTDIAYDEANDKIYFPDYEGHRVVQVNATTGQIEKTWGNRCVISPLPGLPSDCRGNFNGVFGIFYDAIDEFIYVADYGNDRIARFKPSDANILTNWKTYNKAGDSLKKPRGVFVDHPNPGITLIYVADSENSRVVRFRENNIVGTWAAYGVVDPHIDPDRNPPIDGEFHTWESPRSVFFDAGSGYIYASDMYNDRVVRFKMNNAGNYIAGSWDDFHISPTGSGKRIINPIRASYYQGWVYVAEYSNKILRFKPDVNTQDYQILGSSAGSGVGQFNGPYGIIYDQNSEDSGAGSGYIYVANNGDKAIRKFKMDATGGVIAGTWVNFDYWASQGYDFDFNLPTTFPPGFAFGDGVSNPLNAAYAYIEYEVIDTDDSDGANFTSTTVEITGG